MRKTFPLLFLLLLSLGAFGQTTFTITPGLYKAQVGYVGFNSFALPLDGTGNVIGWLNAEPDSNCAYGTVGNGKGFVVMTINGQASCYGITSESTSGRQVINGCTFPMKGDFTFLEPDGSIHKGHVTFTGFHGRFCQGEISGGYVEY